MLPGKARPKSDIAVRKEGVKGASRGLGWRIHKKVKETDCDSFNRLQREPWPRFGVLGNRRPLHCLYLTLTLVQTHMERERS